MIRLLIFLLAAGFGDTHNPFNASLPIWLQACAEKGSVLLSTSLAWLAVAGCSRAETSSQLSSISFAQPCILHFPV